MLKYIARLLHLVSSLVTLTIIVLELSFDMSAYHADYKSLEQAAGIGMIISGVALLACMK